MPETAGAATCDEAQVTRTEASSERVSSVMLAHPKTLRHDATVEAARAFLSDPKVVAAVLTDGDAFCGLLGRDDLPDEAPGGVPAARYARREVSTVTPETPVEEAIAILEREGSSRLVVLDPDGRTLAGLLCLDRRRAGFCTG